jgi:hypothetical protein
MSRISICVTLYRMFFFRICRRLRWINPVKRENLAAVADVYISAIKKGTHL